MTLMNKQEECGCHKDCEYTPHDCDHPCTWPSCLTPGEERELAEEIRKDFEGDDEEPPSTLEFAS